MNEREYMVALSWVDGVGPKNFRALLEHLTSKQIPLEELFQGEEAILSGLPALHHRARVIQGIEAAAKSLDDTQETLDQLAEQEIAFLTFEDEEYPARLAAGLGEQAPPVLYCYGHWELFSEPSAAVVGSRRPDEEGLELAQKAARELVRAGRVVVSGCAAGVDSAAHLEALDAGGNTLGVLSEGLLAARRIREGFCGTADRSSFLLLSQFPPKRAWQAGAAMSRNKTICALADVVIVIQAGVRGGSQHAGSAALKMAKPTFALSPEEPSPPGWEGNAALIAKGAIPLAVDRESGEVDFSPVLNPPSPGEKGKPSGQPTLF